MSTHRAIVFVPAQDYEEHAARCLDYVARRGYKFQGVVYGNYRQAERMREVGETSIVIVSKREHIEHAPEGVEIVSEEPTTDGPRGRRTWPIKKTEEE